MDANGHIIDYQGIMSNISLSLFLVITLIICNDIFNYTIWTWICLIAFTLLVALAYYLL
jgi:hypothetical protein